MRQDPDLDIPWTIIANPIFMNLQNQFYYTPVSYDSESGLTVNFGNQLFTGFSNYNAAQSTPNANQNDTNVE